MWHNRIETGMATPQIISDSPVTPPAAGQVRAEARSWREEFSEPIPGLPYTRQERIASTLRGVDDYRAGRVIPHEEMKQRISSWLSQ
ncbi:MAG: hypothetical protein LBR57_00490 [Alistipes sp.]|nr:hypothetical protein [Alistipes sp.]